MWETNGRHVWETCVGDKCGRRVEDKCKPIQPKAPKTRAPRVGDKCARQVEHKSKLIRPKATRVGDKCAKQVGDKCGKQAGDKCKVMRPKAPRVADKCGKQVCETSVGDKCKLIWPKAPGVGDKWDTSVTFYGARHPDWDASPETKAKSCGPGRQPFERSKNPIVWGNSSHHFLIGKLISTAHQTQVLCEMSSNSYKVL